MIDKEIVIRKEIISIIKAENEKVKDFNVKASNQYIRGFISGYSTAKNVDIPCHWYDQIIVEIES